MEAHIAELKLKSMELGQELANKGLSVSPEWIALNRLIADIQDRHHKAIHGSKLKIEKDITVKDVRNAFMRSGSDSESPSEIIDAEFEELRGKRNDNQNTSMAIQRD